MNLTEYFKVANNLSNCFFIIRDIIYEYDSDYAIDSFKSFTIPSYVNIKTKKYSDKYYVDNNKKIQYIKIDSEDVIYLVFKRKKYKAKISSMTIKNTNSDSFMNTNPLNDSFDNVTFTLDLGEKSFKENFVNFLRNNNIDMAVEIVYDDY